MHGAHSFLTALATVLGVAAVTTVLFQRLRQPVVLGYVLAGLLIGPHLPLPLVADRETVELLSELGVILLMFSLGLEFSFRKLAEVGPVAGITAMVETSLMWSAGFLAGQALGWTTLESVFTGAIVAISSTTIVAKAFDQLGVRDQLRERVFGILIVEDLIAILLLAGLTAVATGSGLSAGALAKTTGRLAFFLGAMLAVGLLVVPRAIRAIRRLDRPETTLVASLGICFAFALAALEAGYSVALGAFLAGSLVAESGEAKYVEALVHPVRDMFAAVFFVSVGMLIDPALIARHWVAVALLVAIVLGGKTLSVSLGAFVTGGGTRTSVRSGMSLAQIGEFSFIIAGLGVSLGATREFLYPVAVAVSALTTLTTPSFIRASGPAASLVDRKLPKPLQTVGALYGSWLEQVRTSPRSRTVGAELRRLARFVLLDAVAIVVLVIGTSLFIGPASRHLVEWLGIAEGPARTAVLGVETLVAIPFAAGIVRNARRMGLAVAAAALPHGEGGQVDLAAAPRKALAITLQLAALILVGLPILAVTQPFLPAAPTAAIVLAVVLTVAVGFWRSATNLEGHVRAGAQVIAEALAKQARQDGRSAHPEEDALARMRELMPGIGEPVALRLPSGSPAAGRTLADLNLRGLTGATVLALYRQGTGVTVPTAREQLAPGDVLALAGTGEAVAAARELLDPSAGAVGPAGPPPPL